MAFLADVDQSSKMLKTSYENGLDMVGTSFKSSKTIVFEKIILITF